MASSATAALIHQLTSTWEALQDHLNAVDAAILVAAVFWHYLCEPARWRCYLGHQAGRRYRSLVHVFSLTALISYTLPAKLGLASRFVLLRRCAGLAFPLLTAWMVVDGLLYYITWATCATLGSGRLFWVGKGEIDSAGRIVMALCIVILAAAFIWLQRHRLLPQGLRDRASRYWERAMGGLRTIASDGVLKKIGIAALVALSDVLVYALRHGALLRIIGHDLPFADLFAVTSVSVSVGLISMLPMGLGGYDLTLVLLLTNYGISTTDAALVVAGNRAANLAMAIVLGLWGGTALGLRRFSRDGITRLTSELQTQGAESSSDKR